MELLVVLLVVIALFIAGGFILGTLASLVGYLLLGLVIGAIARLLVRGTGGMGILTTALYGALGALLGGVLAEKVFELEGFMQFVLSVAIAAVLIAFSAARGRDRDDAAV